MKNTATACINAPAIVEPVATSTLISRAVARVRSRKLDFRLPGTGAALGLLLAVGLAPSAQAGVFTFTLGPAGVGSQYAQGDPHTVLALGALPVGSILQKVTANFTLQSTDNDNYAAEMALVVDPTAAGGGDGLLSFGPDYLGQGFMVPGLVGVEHPNWANGYSGPVSKVKDTKYFGVDWFNSVDLNAAGVFLVNAYPGSGVGGFWSGTITLTYGAPAPTLTWTGSDGTAPMQWSTATGVINWTNTAPASVAYTDGDKVVFDDTVGAGSRTVDISVADVSPGSVTVNNTGANTYTFTGTKAITGSGGLTKEGNGMLVIENANTYDGLTQISAGTVQLGNANALPHGADTDNVILNGTLDLNGNSATLNGLIGTGTVTSSVAGNVTLTLGDADASGTFTGKIQDGLGVVGFTKTGGEAISLSGTLTSGTSYNGTNYAGNSYTGKTVVLGGTLDLTAPLKDAGVASVLGAPVGADATIDLYNGVTFSSNQGVGGPFNQKGWSTNRPLNLAQNGAGTVSIKINGNDTDVVLGAVTATGTGAKTLAVFAGSNGNGDRESVTFNGEISDATGSPLSLEVNFRTQTDSQSYVNLSGVSTFTGPLTLSSASAGSSAYLTLGGVRTRGSETTGSGQLGGGNYAGAISLGGSTILYHNSTASQTFSGVISGAGTLTQHGTGVLTLSGTNTHTGPLSVEVGTLVAASAGALGTTGTATVVTSGATLDVQANIGNEPVSIAGNGVGGQGALVASSGTGTLGGRITLTADARIGGAGTLEVNGIVTANTFALTKVGAGTTNLNATSTLGTVRSLTSAAGMTNVDSALGTGAGIGNTAVSVTGGSTVRFGTVSQTLSSLTIGAGSTVIFTSGSASGGGGGGGGGNESFGGAGKATPFAAAVPEPGSLGLLLVGALGLLQRRREV
ncbi:MAG: autotransporter-associated beta strand repeat-containing protein [Chthoniobacter sp.]|nr:autotransporter-associated beta strand repeat-containing protein [Chthoniobacter sp.]